jgi:hypothetical protein
MHSNLDGTRLPSESLRRFGVGESSAMHVLEKLALLRSQPIELLPEFAEPMWLR